MAIKCSNRPTHKLVAIEVQHADFSQLLKNYFQKTIFKKLFSKYYFIFYFQNCFENYFAHHWTISAVVKCNLQL